MAIITDTTFSLIKNALAQKNTILRDFASLFDVSELQMILMNVRAGNASNYAIGSEIVTKFTYNGVQYDYPWIVLDNNRQCEWENGTIHPGLWLYAKYSTPMYVDFDGPEGVAATEETAQSGVYYCGVSGSTYSMLNLSAGDTIPYSSYDSVLKGSINFGQVYKDGYNRYKDSAVRQWLNSSETAGNWWTPTHLGDNAPGQLNEQNGYMSYLDPEFVDIITPVKIQTATNTEIDSGTTDITYDRFFLMSLEEVYAVPQIANVEGPFFPYWKTATGFNEPSNGTSSNVSAARYIKKLHDTSSGSSPHLRSASKNTSYNVWGMYTNGYIANNVARHGRNVMPACVIS